MGGRCAWALTALCVFLSCWGPIDSPADVDQFLSGVPTYSADRRTIYPADEAGGGYYVEMPLAGKGSGGLCVAAMNNPLDIPLCASTASSSAVTQSGVTTVTRPLRETTSE
ncbi:MAG TPA: hypothetical protein VEJ86_13035 [Candidatus Binataceae bacterium]|nr:hypothetical protein [Candidatus Binataceae bacterium]